MSPAVPIVADVPPAVVSAADVPVADVSASDVPVPDVPAVDVSASDEPTPPVPFLQAVTSLVTNAAAVADFRQPLASQEVISSILARGAARRRPAPVVSPSSPFAVVHSDPLSPGRQLLFDFHNLTRRVVIEDSATFEMYRECFYSEKICVSAWLSCFVCCDPSGSCCSTCQVSVVTFAAIVRLCSSHQNSRKTQKKHLCTLSCSVQCFLSTVLFHVDFHPWAGCLFYFSICFVFVLRLCLV